jgi:uncharacterized protein (TIGR02302 family)
LFDPPKYRLTLPRRSSADNRAVASHDLTEHPLAGQRVRITLVATDGAGQEGRSETLETVLPGRRFSEPLAAAVVEQRGVLALDANNLRRVFDLHDALTIAPDETIPNLSHYLLLESVRGRLAYARSDDDLREAIDYMWGVALQIEDGNLSLAERRLRDAQNALAEALENGASDEEIAQLMDELREAMQEYPAASWRGRTRTTRMPKRSRRCPRTCCASAISTTCSTRSRISPAPAPAIRPSRCCRNCSA